MGIIETCFLIWCNEVFSTIVIPDERVPTELKKAIMQARTEKKLTQSQLAQVLLPPSLSLIIFTLRSCK